MMSSLNKPSASIDQKQGVSQGNNRNNGVFLTGNIYVYLLFPPFSITNTEHFCSSYLIPADSNTGFTLTNSTVQHATLLCF